MYVHSYIYYYYAIYVVLEITYFVLFIRWPEKCVPRRLQFVPAVHLYCTRDKYARRRLDKYLYIHTTILRTPPHTIRATAVRSVVLISYVYMCYTYSCPSSYYILCARSFMYLQGASHTSNGHNSNLIRRRFQQNIGTCEGAVRI